MSITNFDNDWSMIVGDCRLLSDIVIDLRL